MKRILSTAALVVAVSWAAHAQTPNTNRPKTTQTTAQKANTGIPYGARMNYATMTYEQVPRDVRLSFGKAYPNASNSAWEGNEYGYRTSFQQDGRPMSVRYDLRGNQQEVRTGIDVDALPLPVKNSLRGKEANLPYEIRIGNETFYSAEVNGKNEYYDKNGKLIKAPKIK